MPGRLGYAGQVRRNFRQWSTGQLEKFFAEVVGLDDNLDIFCWEEFTLGSAGLRCRAGAAGGALGVEPLGEPWRGFNAGQARPGSNAGQVARNFVAILRRQESTMEQF